ncbi:DNA repair protein REV1 isoform X1 [Ipomoea triloba]|uniref:DNA repair protein REV1 isoform X1 n=1 Tax=Ipomoea triloba TaxID=35885 RepID=UPI00125CEED8|nr:DNA repair protein REV1 isoform X1 [Ipomoea triloba]XP_031129339.1 DNA repair protein REV1 isoform X1 [Ipomoea triloba]
MSFDSSRSANSGSKSKRSLSSNPTSSNTSSKRKKTSQKTLGMAWGANSRSSSRPAFSHSPFSDFGSYMAVKNRKLHQQFDAEASSSSYSGTSSSKESRPIFQGVSIFVDGYTVPSNQELRGYMLRYGGNFENYFSRHRVTHIICSNLPESKIKNVRSFSCGLPVVKPAWVLDSIAANRLLSWVPYQLEQVASEASNQPKLSAFFTSKNCTPAILEKCSTDQAISKGDTPLMEGSVSESGNSSGVRGSVDDSNACNPESSDPSHVSAIGAEAEESSCSGSGSGSYNASHPSTLNASDDCQDEIDKGESILKTSRPSNKQHSTLVDSNFVENYFKNSRLHFIGTWRNRYRKRFPSSSGGFRCITVNSAAKPQATSIIHVDMDCFFVSVVVRNHPELQGKPVAICHSDNPRGTAEISSANYPARNYGVKAGMFVRDAKALCPQLVILSYDFEAYEEVADKFYDILHKHCKKVQAVSCDEAFLDATDSGVEDIQAFVRLIRKEIVEITGCTASAGIAGNMLMARLATRTAKPDGQCCIPPEKVEEYLHELPVKALPGIGYVLEEKLRKREITTCGQLQIISKESLQKDFGIKTGNMLWNYSRGIDNRLVGMAQENKSIGADVNWGVRFKDLKDAQHFLGKLSEEVSLRLQGCGVKGRTFTLKIKKRKVDAGEPAKYLGHGICDNLSHSTTVPMATDEADVLRRIASQLFGHFQIDVEDIRGMGLQVTKLEMTENAKQGNEKNTIRAWLSSTTTKGSNHLKSSPAKGADTDDDIQSVDEDSAPLCSDSIGPLVQRNARLSTGNVGNRQDAALPPMHDLDVSVIESLPPELLSEINNMYNGKLLRFISEKKNNSADICPNNFEGPSEKVLASYEVHPYNKEEVQSVSFSNKLTVDEKTGPVSVSGVEKSNMIINASAAADTCIMPSSLSQVDTSVLQQLPEELKTDILELLPPHRTGVPLSDASLKYVDNPDSSRDSILSNELWVGHPPKWVDKFIVSNCWILKIFAEAYCKAGPKNLLSSILQKFISGICVPEEVGTDGWCDAVSCMCELVKQYVELKIETDIEEVYVCSCLLRRLTTRSKVFHEVYNSLLPYLQASVSEKYGGSLQLSPVKD